MNTKNWMVIRDDAKRTFEAFGQTSNDNAFTNKTYAMQRAGMNVSGMVVPVSNTTATKGLIKIIGYTAEPGLYERLSKQFLEISMRGSEDF